MNRKSLFLLLFFVLLTVFAVYALMVRGRSASSSAGIRSEIPKFNPEEIASVRIEWRTNAVNLKREDGDWKIAEHGGWKTLPP